MLTPEKQFLLHANIKMGLWAVEQCSTYGCIADIIGVHPRKKEVYEFEFKRSSEDLKIAEKKKFKYTCEKVQKQFHPKYEWKKHKGYGDYFNFGYECPKPHRFYYVIPIELWEKEKDYLIIDKFAGVIVWEYRKNSTEWVDFRSVKNVRKRESNTQKFEVVLKDIAARATNIITYDILGKKNDYVSEELRKKMEDYENGFKNDNSDLCLSSQ